MVQEGRAGTKVCRSVVITAALLFVLAGCRNDPVAPGPPTTGEIDIRCLPAGLGAPWSLIRSDQGVAVGYGDSLLAGLPEGEQVFCWGRLPGWLSPDPDTLRVDVVPGRTTPLTGSYGISHAFRGEVVVRPEPEGLAAPWFISSGSFARYQGTGEGDVWLPAGDYTFSWGVMAGYIVPHGIIQLSVEAGESCFLQGRYRQENSPVGDIVIDADPDSLQANWILTGPDDAVRTGQGDVFLYGLPVGVYRLAWSADSRWTLPPEANPQGELTALSTLVFRGGYLSPEPLPVEGLEVHNGQGTGEVEVSWRSLDNLVSPVMEYLVVSVPVGSGEEPDWETAAVLDTVMPRGPGVVYHETMGSEAGLVPGIAYWVTVRGRDVLGRLTPVRDFVALTVDDGHRVAGTLTDHRGRPLAQIPLEITYAGSGDPPQRVVTAEDGTFHGFALWQGAEVSLRTLSREAAADLWYDFETGVLSGGQWEDIHLTLIPRRGVDPVCPQYEGSFLTYFRAMTNTDFPTNQRSDTRLYKWNHFPLSVYIPAYVNDHGMDMQALCATAPETWNDVMGEVYFTTAADSQAADVVFRFGLDIPEANGEVSILAPAGTYYIGDVIPEKMEVYIAAGMGMAQRVREVALHELGHVLGIADHSLCSEAGYLMYITSAGVLDDGPENAIHPDEKALVSCLRYLPQGVDLARYLR